MTKPTERSLFGADYASHYDSTPQRAECDFLAAIFARYADAPINPVLDLGCGTGTHALLLADRGYRVCGVDRAAEMLAAARRKAAARVGGPGSCGLWPVICAPSLLAERFDAAVIMFAVLGYQVSNEDSAATW